MEAKKDNDIMEAGMTRRFLLGTVSVKAFLGGIGRPCKRILVRIFIKRSAFMCSHTATHCPKP